MSSLTNPRRAAHSITVQHVGEETLVYDDSRHRAFCLDRISAAVWNACDGTRTVDQIASCSTQRLQVPIGQELVLVSLDRLQQDGLLQAADVSLSQLAALSRRELLSRLGAGAVTMLPVVAMIAAPNAAHAYNGCADCTPSAVGNGAAAHAQSAQPAPAAGKTRDPYSGQ